MLCITLTANFYWAVSKEETSLWRRCEGNREQKNLKTSPMKEMFKKDRTDGFRNMLYWCSPSAFSYLPGHDTSSEASLQSWRPSQTWSDVIQLCLSRQAIIPSWQIIAIKRIHKRSKAFGFKRFSLEDRLIGSMIISLWLD